MPEFFNQTQFFNQPHGKGKRRALRRAMTRAEALLWQRLRARQASGEKWQRQVGAGVYILDFYCPSRRLVVELDGPSHAGSEAQAYDAARTDYLASMGIRVLRFPNADVSRDLDAVVAAIRAFPAPEEQSDDEIPDDEITRR